MDEKDIESVGWTFLGQPIIKNSYTVYRICYPKKEMTALKMKYCLVHQPYIKQVEISNEFTVLFKGECKNKSELIKLMKQFKIL